MIVSAVASWCQPANAEQAVVKSALASDPTLCAFETLQQGTTPGTAATQPELEAWAQKHAPSYPVVLPNPTAGKLIGSGIVPYDLFVRTDTMKIVGIAATAGAMTASDVATLKARCRP